MAKWPISLVHTLANAALLDGCQEQARQWDVPVLLVSTLTDMRATKLLCCGGRMFMICFNKLSHTAQGQHRQQVQAPTEVTAPSL